MQNSKPWNRIKWINKSAVWMSKINLLWNWVSGLYLVTCQREEEKEERKKEEPLLGSHHVTPTTAI